MALPMARVEGRDQVLPRVSMGVQYSSRILGGVGVRLCSLVWRCTKMHTVVRVGENQCGNQAQGWCQRESESSDRGVWVLIGEQLPQKTLSPRGEGMLTL